jgi:2,5-diketo-D-gluconate reductase A
VHASGLARDDVFITTKCFNNDHGHEQAKRALRESLDELEMAYVDLYLIHWPVPAHDGYVETWQALVELQADGLARAIGVSNFQPAHLERIIRETGVTPAVNQVELSAAEMDAIEALDAGDRIGPAPDTFVRP